VPFDRDADEADTDARRVGRAPGAKTWARVGARHVTIAIFGFAVAEDRRVLARSWVCQDDRTAAPTNIRSA